MNALSNIIGYESMRKAILEEVSRFTQDILQHAHKTQQPREVFAKAYGRLTDEQKIAFILAGGVPSLFHYQQSPPSQARTDPDAETGQLPVLC